MSSLRWRLALAFALLAATVAAAVGVVVYQVTSQDLLSRARAAAVAQVQSAALIYPLTKPSLPRSALPAGDPSVPAPLRAAVRRGQLASYSGTWNGKPAVWAGRRTPDGRDEIYVRDSYAAQRQELSDLRQTVIEVAAAAAAGGALVGLLLAGRLSLRLRRAAAIAERVTAGELDARIHAGGRDEVAKLGEAIDRMAEAMRAADRARAPVRRGRRPRPAHSADRAQDGRQPARPRPGRRRHPRARRPAPAAGRGSARDLPDRQRHGHGRPALGRPGRLRRERGRRRRPARPSGRTARRRA